MLMMGSASLICHPFSTDRLGRCFFSTVQHSRNLGVSKFMEIQRHFAWETKNLSQGVDVGRDDRPKCTRILVLYMCGVRLTTCGNHGLCIPLVQI